jgi:hypothetical protein
MSSDIQLKTSQFNTLAFDIRVSHLDFFRGKTLSKVFKITRDDKNLPMLSFAKGIVPEEIKEKLNAAFKSIFV